MKNIQNIIENFSWYFVIFFKNIFSKFFENIFEKKFNFLHDEKIFLIQIFFYELEYASRVQKNTSEHLRQSTGWPRAQNWKNLLFFVLNAAWGPPAWWILCTTYSIFSTVGALSSKRHHKTSNIPPRQGSQITTLIYM